MAKNAIERVDRNLARRLREARKEVGLSVRSVSSKMQKHVVVSHTTISSYENGATVPPINVLASLATLYKRPISWFLDSRATFTGFRYRNLQSRVSLAEQRQYAALAGKWAEAYFALEKRLRLPKSQLKITADVANLSADAIATLVRTQCLNLNDSQPVIDTIDVLESFPAWAIELRANFGVDGAAANLDGKQVVIINPEVSNERARLNAAYELAFVLLSHGEMVLSTEVERQAQTFASTFLMPDSQLLESFRGKSFLKLIKYKEKFGVSLAAMIYRAEQLRIINTTASRWLRSEMVKRGWRKKEPGYVWRDRAITFETMLESAIQTKQLTWEEASRITSIPDSELKARLDGATRQNDESSTGMEDDTPATLKYFQ